MTTVIPTTEDNFSQLKKTWDDFSLYFQEVHEQFGTKSTAFTILCNILRLGSHKVQTILEAGCGAGGSTQLIYQLLSEAQSKNNSSYTTIFKSIDLSTEMVKLTQKRATSFQNSKIKFELNVGNVEDLPNFENNYFEVIYSGYVLHLTPDPKKALSEFFRILKQGGSLAFNVWGHHERSLKFTLIARAKNRLLGKPDWEDQDFLSKQSPFHLNDKNFVFGMLKQVGFSNIRFVNLVEPYECFGEPIEFVKEISGSPKGQQYLNGLSLEEREKFLKHAEDIVLEYWNQGNILSCESAVYYAKKPQN